MSSTCSTEPSDGGSFSSIRDYQAFAKVLHEAQDWLPMRLLAFCLMPNHWHLVLCPHKDRDLSEWMRWITVTHMQRWPANHHSGGTGPLYQGRFKLFPLQEDEHFWTVYRYVERNALRAKLVRRAENWPWSSLGLRVNAVADVSVAEWPVSRPRNWMSLVNQAQSEAELQAVRRCLVRGAPFSDDAWVVHTARRLGLQSTLRPRGRPKKKAAEK